MSIIAIISAVFSLLRLLPTAITIVNEIIQLFQSLKPGVPQQKALMGEFRAAIKAAREKSDVTPLETFHKKLGALCATGGLCDDPSLVSPTEGS